MEFLNSILLTGLEGTFVFVLLTLLHSQRRVIGNSSFHIALGVLLLFGLFIRAANLKLIIWGNYEALLSVNIIFLPIMVAYMVVYITEGVLAAQRIIIGIMVFYGLYLYLAEVTALQSSWLGFSIDNSSINAVNLENLLRQTKGSLNLFAVIFFIDFFIIPICYSKFKKIKLPRIICIWGALFAAQIFSTISLELLGETLGYSPKEIAGEVILRSALNLWIGFLAEIYLLKIDTETAKNKSRPLELLFAFFGSYGRSKELESDLREWEDRYQQVLQNAAEMIIMTTTSGKIFDANISASKLFGFLSPEKLTGHLLFPRIKIIEPSEEIDFSKIVNPISFKAIVDEVSENKKIISGSISSVIYRGRMFLVFVARDITEETILEEEKRKLSEELVHSQRLESLGHLAGGVAHDFNNYIHAILGHMDLMEMQGLSNQEQVEKRLAKISEIAEQASNLTSQLLGFARKGRYQPTSISPHEIMQKSLAILGTSKNYDIDISLRCSPSTPNIHADMIQMQQIIVNLIINAVDSMKNNKHEKILQLYCAPATELPIPIQIPKELKNVRVENYVYIMIKDNGCGIPEDIQQKIFEPFFTTKPVGEGTGMGLSMVYGAISNHNGWIQLVSSPDKGTAFYLLLPTE